MLCATPFAVASGCERPQDEGRIDGSTIDAVPVLTFEETIRIGHLEDLDLGFSQIGPPGIGPRQQLTVTPEGDRLYVFDMNEVRVFDAATRRLIRSVGRRGDGPGEYQQPYGIGLMVDTLWIFEIRGIHMFTPDGTFLRYVPRRSTQVQVDGLPTPVDVVPNWPLSDGGIMASVRPLPDGHPSVVIPRFRFSGDGQRLDTIGTMTLTPWRADGLNIDGLTIPPPPALTKRLQREHLTIEWNDSGELRITRTNAAMDTVIARTLRYEPFPFPQATADSAIEMLTERALSTYLQRERDVPPAAARDSVLAYIGMPTALPPVTQLLEAADGSLLLRREEPELLARLGSDGAHWRYTLLDAQLNAVGEILLPRDLWVHVWDGERLWGVVHDEYDVPWVIAGAVG